MSNTELTNKQGMNSYAHEGLAVPSSQKTSAVLLIYSQVRSKFLQW